MRDCPTAETRLKSITTPKGICLYLHVKVYYLVIFPILRYFMLSKTAEYALRAVACMGSQTGTSVSADHLAEQTKVPRRYLARVLQDLASAGLVRSRPGPGGGYELCRSTGKISILDVVKTVAPIERIRTCPTWLEIARDPLSLARRTRQSLCGD